MSGMPYRGGKDASRVAPEREGLVADMVRQFADPHAFVRELVQNGIDAGASALEVKARFDGEVATFSVLDDGGGMTREDIEGPLLTLFTSAKDGDDSKIGKYGVGFVSVFAIEPERVEVRTWQGGEAWHLTLFPDHRYELRPEDPMGRRHPTGTRVTLYKTLDAEAFDHAVDHVGAALARWCRHANVPLHWIVERGESLHRERADRPFDIAASVSLASELEDARLVVGVAAGASYLFEGDEERSFAGWYNHGLTLSEQSDGEAVLPGLRFKVDSPSLQHTLSRDDVRRDEAYHRLRRHVVDLVQGPLRARLQEGLREAAEQQDALRYVALLAAAGPRGLRLAPSEIAVPLCQRVDGAWVRSALELVDGDASVLWSSRSNALTAGLAARHRPVIRALHEDVPRVIDGILAAEVEPAEAVYLLLEQQAAPSKRATKLLAELRRVLSRAGLKLHPLRLAKASGAAAVRVAYTVTDPGPRHLVHARAHPRLDGGFGQKRLVVVQSHPAVRAALRMAHDRPHLASQLLARYILVEDRGQIARGTNADLVDMAPEAL